MNAKLAIFSFQISLIPPILSPVDPVDALSNLPPLLPCSYLVPCHSLCSNSVYHSPPDMHPCKLLCQAALRTYITDYTRLQAPNISHHEPDHSQPNEPYQYQITWITSALSPSPSLP